MGNFLHALVWVSIFALLVVFLSWVLWPEKGLLAKLKKMGAHRQRVLLEDALKYLYDCEYKGAAFKPENLLHNLDLSQEQWNRLSRRLQSLELVSSENGTYMLTEAGRSYALRVIRRHRLWERYLADETGLPHTEWHTQADYLEHTLSGEDIDKLAARIGNPAFDPHGDPIPTASGELPTHKGKPLSGLKEGDVARIIHIEDEPVEIYRQLAMKGLYPGLQVHVLKSDEEGITFAADGEERTLIPPFARQVTVETVAAEKVACLKPERLSSLKIGEKAEVVGISPHLQGPQRRRLMDLGIVPGQRISAIIQSASGDPVGYRIMGTTIGIRRNQSDQIFIGNKEKEYYGHTE
ncbi:metal-dependent transcriptional regulator [Proteiniphilum sp. X52]|uniref:metal-dependent transcriptional regulator n=1 Tax=Proteiniphilum sp. X52 TaxID=2382159 RepID=UPI000F0A9602|nr:metal-dependent transcriptional regulator [Proteiniphilum sp. X52]RNC63513.1 DNA-binding protein [Proteiniphilum sp. X52]